MPVPNSPVHNPSTDHAPSYAAYITADEEWQYVDPGTAALLQRSALSLLGQTLRATVPKGSLADIRMWLQRAREDREPVEPELRYGLSTGQQLRLRITPQFAHDGALHGYHVIGWHLPQGSAVRHQASQYSQAARVDWGRQENTHGDPRIMSPTSRWHAFTFTLNVEGSVLDVNQSTLDLLERTRSTLLHQRFWELPLFPDGEQEAVQRALAHAKRNEHGFLTVTCQLPRGRIRRLELTIRPVQDEQTSLNLLVAEGVARPEFYDDHYSAREVEENFIHLIATCQDAVVFVDAQRHITLFNRSAERMFGRTAGDVIGQALTTLMPEPYASEHGQYIDRYLAGGAAQAIGKVITAFGRRDSGEVFPIELAITELRLNAHARFAAFIRDVSLQRAMQQELDHQRQLSTIGLTASIFAHEVGNPLNNMGLQTEVLIRGLSKEPSALLDTARHIRGEIGRLSRLLAEFRELGQPSVLQLQPVPLSGLLLEVVRSQRISNPHPNVKIKDELEENLPAIQGHPDKLRQMLINLCKNALEAMGEQGMLTLRARRVGDGVDIQIEDTGSGVPADVDVFEPFVTTKTDGTGLGLAVSQRVAHDHGGTLSYRTQPGKGTTFTVHLPQSQCPTSSRRTDP